MLKCTIKELLAICPESDAQRVFPVGDKMWQPGKKTLIMGILNCTPDSFSDGGKYNQIPEAVRHALEMVDEGADIIDIGGHSTRPGAEDVPEHIELERVIPVIKAIREQSQVPISVDTFRSNVAQAALEAGADMVNDVTAGRDPAMFDTVGSRKAAICMMHMRGTPHTMTQLTTYNEGLIPTIASELQLSIQRALPIIPRWRMWIDPGIGFAKTAQQSSLVIRDLHQMTKILGNYGVVVGLSRKRFLTAIVGSSDDNVTSAACVAAVFSGANLLRVHNVKLVKQAISIADTLINKP